MKTIATVLKTLAITFAFIFSASSYADMYSDYRAKTNFEGDTEYTITWGDRKIKMLNSHLDAKADQEMEALFEKQANLQAKIEELTKSRKHEVPFIFLGEEMIENAKMIDQIELNIIEKGWYNDYLWNRMIDNLKDYKDFIYRMRDLLKERSDGLIKEKQLTKEEYENLLKQTMKMIDLMNSKIKQYTDIYETYISR